MSISPSFSIDRDQALYSALNDRARSVVGKRLRALRRIHQARSVAAGCRAVLADCQGERGFSPAQLAKLYTAYTAEGDWKVLVNAAVAGPKWYGSASAAGLPDAFLDWLAKEWAHKQRGKFYGAWREMMQRLDRWRRGDLECKLPGFETPPPAAPGRSDGVPEGFGYSNLRIALKNRASKFARTVVAIGPKHAHLATGPTTPGTREHAEPGQYYIADDSWNDFKVVAFGQTVRLLSLHYLDLASGMNLVRGHKPALVDERDIERRLSEREMIWLTVTLLTTRGYRESGCTIICEKGTATIREREESILHDCGTGIAVKRGPRGGGPGVGAMFTGPGGGNPRWKAPLESWFNLLRNRTDNFLEFPGQTGSNSRLNLPEGLAGLERDTRAWLEVARGLPPEWASQLQMGMLSATDAIFALEKVIEAINWRIDHHLEGWRRCGHFVQEWRAAEWLPWQPAAALDAITLETERLAIASVLGANSALKRERPLSPAEVWDAGSARLKKLPLHVAALLMREVPAAEDGEASVKSGVLEVMVREVDPDEPLRFGLVRHDGRGTRDLLRDGEKYLVRVNGIDPRWAWLYRADGSFAGVAQQYGRVGAGREGKGREDTHALHAAWAEKRKAIAELTGEARLLGSRITRAETDRLAHNLDVLKGAKAAQRKPGTNESTEAATDILTAVEPTTPPEESGAAEDLLAALTGTTH
jgi:hypothetical protein